MRALPHLACAALLTACTAPESAPVSPPRAPAPPAHAVLSSSGEVAVGEERFDLADPGAAARLARRLKALGAAAPEGARTLYIEAERGTAFALVERLMAVLETAEVEDYRLDLGR